MLELDPAAARSPNTVDVNVPGAPLPRLRSNSSKKWSCVFERSGFSRSPEPSISAVKARVTITSGPKKNLRPVAVPPERSASVYFVQAAGAVSVPTSKSMR